MVVQKRVKRPWSFPGLATMVRIMLMYYVNLYTFLENPEKDWVKLLKEQENPPPQLSLFDQGAYFSEKTSATPIYWLRGWISADFFVLADSNN